MTNWLQRGLVFAAAMVVLRLVQGVLINTWESQSGLISMALLVLFVVGVVLWGLYDGREDATANPDPDRRRDLAMTWLAAGLVAGAVSGVLAWLIALFDKALYVGGLINELTVFAAFTALLVFVPAMGGVVFGRWLVDRGYTKAPQRHHGLAAEGEDRVDTDVFAAVSVGADAAGSSAATAADGTTAPAAAAPASDWPTEEFPAATDEAPAETAEAPAETAEAPAETAEASAETAEAPAETEQTQTAVPSEEERPDDAR